MIRDSIARGEDNFASVQPAIQIGILDFTLFPDAPEFCASYKMMNVRSHKLYNDKFELKVLQLNQIKLATEDDKLYNLDEWARLFKAKTWEQNKYLNEAATSVFRYESDYSIRKRCQDREDALREEAAKNRKITLLQNEIAGLLNKNSTLQDENSNLQNEITELRKQLAEALNK